MISDYKPATLDELARAHNTFFGLGDAGGVPQQDRLTASAFHHFKDLLQEEFAEAREVLVQPTRERSLVMMADWLADICCYCFSEAARLGIPLEECMKLVFTAQYTKIMSDGKPLVVQGRIYKGPNYVAPNQKIAELLCAAQCRGAP